MNAVDAVGMIAEILSWVGLGVGLPLLTIVLLVKVHDGPWLRTRSSSSRRRTAGRAPAGSPPATSGSGRSGRRSPSIGVTGRTPTRSSAPDTRA